MAIEETAGTPEGVSEIGEQGTVPGAPAAADAGSSTEAPEGSQSTTPSEEGNPPDHLAWLNGTLGGSYEDEASFRDEYARLKQYSNLPEPLRRAHQYAQGGGNLQDFFQQMGTDYTALSDDEVLFQHYLQNNPGLKGNLSLARGKYEREVAKKYELKAPEGLDEEGLTEWETAQANELKFLQDSKVHDAAEARKGMETWRDEQLGAYAPPNLEEIQQNHLRDVQQSMASLNSLSIDYGGDTPFEYGLNAAMKAQVQGLLESPQQLMEFLGMGKGGTDYATLCQKVATLVAMETMPAELIKFQGHQKDIGQLAGEQYGIDKNRSEGAGGAGGMSFKEELSAAFAAKKRG